MGARREAFVCMVLIDCLGALTQHGQSGALHNIFVERLRQTIKYEGIYLEEYANM